MILNGDSLTVGVGASTIDGRWPNLLLAQRPGLTIRNYAVGSMTVEWVRDQVVAENEHDKACAQFVNLGMPDTGDAQQYIDAADAVMAAIPHGRILICTPIAGDYPEFYPDGSAYAGRIEAADHILSAYPDNAFDLHQILLDANDGSVGDLEDVAKGVTPRSLRLDNIHWNDAGQAIVAAAVDAFLTSKDWMI